MGKLASREIQTVAPAPVSAMIVVIIWFNLLAATLGLSIAARYAGLDLNISDGHIGINIERFREHARAARSVQGGIRHAVLTLLGNGLTPAVVHSRNRLRPVSEPIPPYIRGILSRYFAPGLLDSTRWTVMSPWRATLDTAIFLLSPGTAAVTFDDVIVFRSRPEAETDWKTWAHELTHVMQYETLGVEFFVLAYATSLGRQLEVPAYRLSDHIELHRERVLSRERRNRH